MTLSGTIIKLFNEIADETVNNRRHTKRKIPITENDLTIRSQLEE